MYCKICKKNVRSIGHWARDHSAYLQKKRTTSRTVKPKPSKKGDQFGSIMCAYCNSPAQGLDRFRKLACKKHIEIMRRSKEISESWEV